MPNFFDPDLSILPPGQRQFWNELGPMKELGMVLYGGTAIALQLGHRRSVDFDFFSDLPLDKRRVRAVLPLLANSTTVQDADNTLSVVVPMGLEGFFANLSFFGGIAFGRVGEPRITRDRLVYVASLDDLMATKVVTLLQRVEVKDYIDIAAMISAGVSLERGLAAAALLYAPAFQPSESLKAMTYFEGEEFAEVSDDIRRVLVKAVDAIKELPEVSRTSYRLAP